MKYKIVQRSDGTFVPQVKHGAFLPWEDVAAWSHDLGMVGPDMSTCIMNTASQARLAIDLHWEANKPTRCPRVVGVEWYKPDV